MSPPSFPSIYEVIVQFTICDVIRFEFAGGLESYLVANLNFAVDSSIVIHTKKSEAIAKWFYLLASLWSKLIFSWRIPLLSGWYGEQR